MGVLDDRDLADAEALALELRSARTVTRGLRKAVARLIVLALAEAAKARLAADGRLTPVQQQAARDALNTAIAGLYVDVGAQTVAAVTAGIALALRQEKQLLPDIGVTAEQVLGELGADPVLADAGAATGQILGAAIAGVEQALAGPIASAADLEALAGLASAVTSKVDRQVRYLTNRSINQTTVQIVKLAPPSAPAPVTDTGRTPLTDETPAEAPTEPVTDNGEPPLSANGRTPMIDNGLRLVWVAERDACLTCLALSGHVADPNQGLGFDEFATFSPHPAPTVWPPGMPLMGPPRHPNCRCRLRIIAASNTMVPDALRREAERTVARGWSGHDSRRSRLAATDMLVRRANRLPMTVNERARRDVGRGEFSTRHRPRAQHLRAD